jgi:hypothetical protein
MSAWPQTLVLVGAGKMGGAMLRAGSPAACRRRGSRSSIRRPPLKWSRCRRARGWNVASVSCGEVTDVHGNGRPPRRIVLVNEAMVTFPWCGVRRSARAPAPRASAAA